MKTIWTLLCLCLALMIGCETPYTGHLGPEGFNGWIESEENGFVCLWNGFDRLCIKTIPGRDGKDGKDGKDGRDGTDGKDGQTLVAVREVPVEVIIEKIIETVVIEEVIKEIPVEIVTERVVTEFVDREVPIEVFIEKTVEIIKEVVIEVPVGVPVEVPVEVVREVEVPVEVIKEVPVQVIVNRIKTIYSDTETGTVSVTAGAIYTEAGYHNPPTGFHAHQFTHTHDGATHTHRIIHQNGVPDDWEQEHRGSSGLTHD